VVYMAGAPSAPPEKSGVPHALVIAGGLDPLAPPARLEAAADRARGAGQAVDYRVLPDEGHTLVVTAVLRGVVAWLLAR
jgi:acetyl esterase/lipase